MKGVGKGRTKGLPTKKLNVLRKSKSGKVSMYQQSYHVSAFEKTKGRSGNDGKQTSDLKDNNKADNYNVSVSSKMKSDKKQKLQHYVENLTPVNGKIGSVAVDKIVSKVKTKNDMSQLKESYFNQVFKEGFFNGDNVGKHGGLLKDTSRLINKLPANEHNYREISNSLISNASSISDHAMVNMVSAVADRGLMESVLAPTVANESYDKDEFRHNYYVKYSNPMSQLNTLYQDNSSDPAKASVQHLYGLANDLDHITNVPKLTETDVKLWENWIDQNSRQIKQKLVSNKLYNTLLVELSPSVAAELYKTNKMISLPIYQSTFMH